MTTPPADPQPPTDMDDAEARAGAPTGIAADTAIGAGEDVDTDSGDDSSATDAMGIDEDDPIDATLVGSPVDDKDGDRGVEGATTQPAGTDAPAS